MTSTPPLESLDCTGDPISVGHRWEKWKRALLIFLEATSVIDPLKKRAILLHTGGLGLQEIYYNLPGAQAEEASAEGDVFQIALSKLDTYFSPKHSRIFERHVFRLIKQQDNEKFNSFLVRLRDQANKCNFQPLEDNVIDQIVEKCNSAELRKKILSVGDAMTLDMIIIEANALEAIERQMLGFTRGDRHTETINKITTHRRTSEQDKSNPKTNWQEKNTKVKECTRCGSKYHWANDAKCPAKDKTCRLCRKDGHFARCCRSKATKREAPKGDKDKSATNKKPKTREDVDSISQDVDYIFHLDNDDLIKCVVGGVETEMIIDSGSQSNIISEETWQELKKRDVQVQNQIKTPNKVLRAYASDQPLKVIGSFESEICIGNSKDLATFYVIENGKRNLLGKTTAIKLGVLRIGLGINAVNDQETHPFPKFKNISVEIPIDDKVKPVSQPYRRIPIPLEERVEAKLDEMMRQEIIEEVNEPSKWVSPIVVVPKGNADVRICVDMRRANQAIQRENYPLPTMNELLPNFKKAQLFSKLDIKNAFHQVEISKESRHITTFITKKGLFRYTRLMFGITCAPELFQKILGRILAPCEGTVNFIDDILVWGADREEHDKRLEMTLRTLQHNNVYLNEEKCIFRVQRIDFLGHELSPAGIKPLERYTESIKTFRKPQTIEEIHSFLGLIQYIGKWVPHLATLTEPLRELLRLKLSKHAKLEGRWKERHERAFQELKVMADASPVGLGAVLIQHDKQGPRIIAYGSKSLSDCERRYCQTEKEALALVWAVEHFRMYLFGKNQFELITDHKPLETIFAPTSKPCARIERWVLRLQSYRYRVIYRPGKSNLADPLSRLCEDVEQKGHTFDDEEVLHQIADSSRPIAVSQREIRQHSRLDEDICKVREGIYNNQWAPSINNYKVFETELCFVGDVLLRGNKIVIPMKLRRRVLEAAHEGHPGIVAMKNRLRTKVWWPKIDNDAETLVRACKGCTLVSAPDKPNPMKRRELPLQPWIDLAIDFFGPLPTREYFLVIIDYYSRYLDVQIMKQITAENTIKVLQEVFARLGFPVSMTLDNGSQLRSIELAEYCKEYNITLYPTIPYWPQQNGEVERQNRNILKRLKIAVINKRDWKKELLDFLIMHNSTPNSVTGKTPAELFFRRQFRDKIPSVATQEPISVDSEMRDRDKQKKEEGKYYADQKRRAQSDTLDCGDKVYVRNMTKVNKLTPNFDQTPHTIIDKKGSDVQVQNDSTGKIFRRNIVHLKRTEGQWKVCDNTEEENPADQSPE